MGKFTAEQYGCTYYQNTAEMYRNENIEAVFICVGPQAHPELTIEAFESGLHVWLEKPVAVRAFEVNKMLEKRGDRVAVVGLKKIFMPAVEKTIEIVQSKDYGDLTSLLGIYPITIPENGQKILEQRTVTNWLVNSCHPLSLMMAVGGLVESVTIHRGKNGSGVCILKFSNGVIGNFHIASSPRPVEAYHFYSEKWNLKIENNHKVILQRGVPSVYGETTKFPRREKDGDDTGAIVWEPQFTSSTLENRSEFIQGIYFEMKHFCDCVLNNRPSEKGTLEFALEIMKVYEAALLSDGDQIQI